MENIKPGIYQHYKGAKYELLFIAKQTETDESLAVYRSLKDNQVWSRPLSMWLEKVTANGKEQPRFKWLEEARPRYPEAAVGPIIYNDKNEVFLIKNPKNNDTWTIPGGHVEWGEEMAEALVREVKEETALEIDQIEFINATDGIKPKNFLKTKHFIFLNFFAHYAGGEPILSNEMSEYIWVDPAEALANLEIAPSVSPLLELFINRQNNKEGEWEQKYLRALADYQNLLKNSVKEKQEFAKFALNDFLQDILPVYDHLKMSINSLPDAEKNNAWVKGVEYVLKQFGDILNDRGVKEIKTLGEHFDHNKMEAIEGDGDIVVQEIMPGYSLHDRVIRPAKVKVANKKEK